jgi:hypothetical protein
MAHPLIQYLNNKSGNLLDAIVLAVEEVIENEQLYDPNNTQIVLANQELESALNVRSCHRDELREVIARRLLIPQGVIYSMPDPLPEPHKRYNYRPSPYRSLMVGLHANSKVVCRPKLAVFIQRQGYPDTNKTVFTYGELTALISKYLLEKRQTLFDDRNVRVANLIGDPLGEVLGVLACHKSQVTRLLQEQLIPFYE